MAKFNIACGIVLVVIGLLALMGGAIERSDGPRAGMDFESLKVHLPPDDYERLMSNITTLAQAEARQYRRARQGERTIAFGILGLGFIALIVGVHQVRTRSSGEDSAAG